MKTPRQLDREIADHQERARLQQRVQKLLDKWQPILGVTVREFRIKKMRAFGSLNLPERRLWIGQALATMSPADLEYVVVHELVHLLGVEKGSGHDEGFYTLMDRHLPSWRRRHAQLHSGEGVAARKLPGMGRGFRW
ncbi:MAG: M48 family metallopeptidase [Myxococcota bacterium]|nr:M48 family metallopeptidase [Myxococcota bacterium]